MNKTETEVYNFLTTKFSEYTIIKEFKDKEIKNVRELPFDFCMKEPKIIIEIDGIQHFKNVGHWSNDFEEIQQRDCYKMKLIQEKGYRIIRVFQEDIWSPRTREEILDTLEKTIKKYVENTNLYIDYICVDKELYKDHEYQMNLLVSEL